MEKSLNVSQDDDAADAFETATRLRSASAGKSGGKLSLLVMGERGVQTFPLPERGELLVGRSAECHVRIDDANLSRKHLLLRLGERIEIEDLESLNGTRVGDRKLAAGTAQPLREGEVITLGDTIMVVQRNASERPRHLWGHGYFEARLEDECVRAAQSPRAFSIARIRLALPGQSGAAEPIFAEELPAGDAVAAYAPGEYEVLLLDREPDVAHAGVAKLRTRLAVEGIAASVGVASYPVDGRTPEALVEVAGARARGQAPATFRPLPQGAIERLRPLLERIAGGNINVLILGETGVGKDVLAETIHRMSARAKMPLLRLNCAALSETLLESELFGYEKGAFTGAQASKPGLLETAEGGTVFLDELGEMPLAIQAKLLRVIEERKVLRVGAVKTRDIDVRFIAATNRDLEAEAQRGRFRADLYFRLNGISLTLPPLRERVDEIEGLVRVLVTQACKQAGFAEEPRVSSAAMTLLKRYRWPGNIRELRNVLERAVLLCTGGMILPEHLPLEKMGPTLTAAATTQQVPLAEESVVADPADATQERPRVENDERQRILEALQKCAGNQTRAAQLLGISRRTLVSRLADFDLPRPRKRR